LPNSALAPSAAVCVRSQPAQPAQDAALSTQRRNLRKRSGPQVGAGCGAERSAPQPAEAEWSAGWRRMRRWALSAVPFQQNAETRRFCEAAVGGAGRSAPHPFNKMRRQDVFVRRRWALSAAPCQQDVETRRSCEAAVGGAGRSAPHPFNKMRRQDVFVRRRWAALGAQRRTLSTKCGDKTFL